MSKNNQIASLSESHIKTQIDDSANKSGNVGGGTLLQLNRPEKLCGLSLIEMLVVLLIFAVLAGFTPIFIKEVYRKNQRDVVADEIKLAIQYSKINALTKSHSVVLSPLAGHVGWSDGMALCLDNELHQCADVEGLIREWHWYHKGIQVNWFGFQSNHYLRFTPDLMGRAANGYFSITDPSMHELKLVVNRLGRCRVTSSLS